MQHSKENIELKYFQCEHKIHITIIQKNQTKTHPHTCNAKHSKLHSN